MPQAQAQTALHLRPLRVADLRAVTAIDARHTGVTKLTHWREVLARARGAHQLALGAEAGGHLAGYLFGEIRAWEFGSPPTGWIYAVGVDPKHARQGIATRLVLAARRWFTERGAAHVRTMVRRGDIELLRFFRASGFAAAPYVELECASAPPTAKRSRA